MGGEIEVKECLFECGVGVLCGVVEVGVEGVGDPLSVVGVVAEGGEQGDRGLCTHSRI